MNEMELTLREELFPHWIIYAVLAMISILSVIKSQREMVFVHIKNAFFKPPSSVPAAKESLSFYKPTNWIMLFNFFVITGLSVYMVLLYTKNEQYWLVYLPVLVYVFHLFSFYLVAILSGEYKRVREQILLLNFTAHLIGIVLIPILIVWILNPHFSVYMNNIMLVAIGLLYFIRIVRGMWLAYRNNVLWYYIILYLCGLEIWPITVGFLLVSPDFIG